MKRSILFLLWAVTILSANALEVTIHGLNYFLDSKSHEAVIISGGTCSGELDIPSEVCYNGETFVVKSMIWKAFDGLVELTKVKIPKTLESIMHEYPQEPTYEDVELPYVFYPCTNPFTRCTSLESIEVDEENPGMKSVGGVLFSKDGTWLYAYPAGIKAASYDVPQGVTQVGTFALANENLKKVDLAESVQAVGLNICYDSSLDTLIIRGRNVEDISMRGWFLECLKDTAKLYVPASEVERYKSLYSGTVLPLEEYEGRKVNQEYFPEGTKWTEIRLDTLKYDSWYSKVGDEWVPNFETIEYRVGGEYTDQINGVYNCVYTNGPEWTDSLTLLIYKWEVDGQAYWNGAVTVAASDDKEQLLWPFCGQMYPLSWEVGTPMSSLSIEIAGATGGGWPWEWDEYGTVEEIKEGDFGGVRPLKYSDVNGIRFIQGIGVASWNDGECIFGPIRPYEVLSHLGAVGSDNRHYRSMLVHFEREGEVLYDVWPEKPHQPLPFLEGNPIWEYKYERLERRGPGRFIDRDIRSFSYYFLCGQKEIEGKVYKMMGEVINNGNNELTVSRWLPVREENGIVYALTDSLPGLIGYDYLEVPHLQVGKECVLYNFCTEIGETLYPGDDCTKVESYGIYQLMDGTICRVLKTREGAFYLYEKLGYIHDCLYHGVMDPPSELIYSTGGDVYADILNAYCQDSKMLYKAPDAQEGLCVNDTCWTRDDAYEYARSYKADPRQEEVFSYIRRLQKASEVAPVAYTEGQMATIVLPTEPDAGKGKYYRLDRVEGNEIIFKQELQPCAHVPYIIVPGEDFSIEVSAMELDGLRCDTASVEGISFIGTFQKEEVESQEGFYIELIDTTPDCSLSGNKLTIGALRAYLLVHWDDPYNHGGTKVPAEKMQIVLRDDPNSIQMVNGKSSNGKCYDLSGKLVSRKSLNRKLPRGIYIEEGRKVLER